MQLVLHPSSDNGYSSPAPYSVDYRTLLEHVPVIAYSATPDVPYRALHVSPQIEQMLGFTQAEWVTHSDLWVRRIHPDDRERVLAEVARAREAGQGISVEYRMIASDGGVKHFRDDVRLVRDSEGKPLALHGVMIDITERRRAEAALREAESRLYYLMGKVDAGATEGVVGYARDITQLRRAVESLLSSETRFKMAAELASDLIYEWGMGSDQVEYLGDVDGRLGYGLGEFPRTVDGWAATIHPEDRERVLSAFRRALDSGQPLCEEYRARRKDGSYLHWIDRGCTLPGESGGPDRWVGVVTDVTERESAETHLRESEHRFRMLAERAADMIYRVELFPSLRYSYVSPAVETILGYSPEEFYADPSLQNRLVHPDDLAMLETLRGEPTGAPIPPFRAFHRDGRMVWLEHRDFPVRDKSGRIVAYEGIVRDVTERENAAITLRQSEEKYRSLFDSSLDTILVVDGTGRYVDANPAACDFTGYYKEELAGMTFRSLTPPDLLTRGEELFTQLLETGQVASEFRVLCKDGSQKDVEFRVTRAGPGRYQAVMRDITDRKMAVEAILRSEGLYRTLVESLDDDINVKDREGRYFLVNSQTTRRLGLPREGIIGKTTSEVHSHQVAAAVAVDDARVLDTGEVVDSFREIGDRAVAKYCNVRKTPLRDPSGEIIGVVTVSRDVTAQLEARKALEESEERFRSIFNNTAVGVIVADPAGVIVNANQAMCDFLGYGPGELIGKLDSILIPAGEEDPRQGLREAFSCGALEKLVTDRPFVRKDGQVVWGRLAVSLARDEEGVPRHAVVVVEDITVRREVEAALKEATSTLSALVRSAPVAITLTDRDMKVTVWNPAAERLFGWKAHEVIGKPLPIVPADGWADSVARHRSALASEPVTDLELRRLRKDGSLVDISLSVAPVQDAEGRPIGTVATYVDLSHRKRIELALSRSLEVLRESMEGIIQAMAVITEARDPYTAGHQKRVSQLAAAIAVGMDLPEGQVEGVRWAGLVHDLGKIGIPAEILSKPGKLSDLEDGLVRTHARAGYDVLKGIRFPWPIAEVVLRHHERLDGSGYPEGTRGAAIPLAARILAVADVVEAMASHRPYRPALGLDAALAEIQEGRGTLYDPRVVDACVHLFTSGVSIWE